MGYAKKISVILAAKKRSSTASALRGFLTGAIMIGAFLTFNGLIEPLSFAYASVIALLIATFSPQFSRGSTYEDLLDSLDSKLEQ